MIHDVKLIEDDFFNQAMEFIGRGLAHMKLTGQSNADIVDALSTIRVVITVSGHACAPQKERQK